MNEEDAEIAIQELRYFLNDGIGRAEPEHIRTILDYVTELKSDIADLRDEARRGEAWEGRYWTLLAEAEAGRPRQIAGGEESYGVAPRTIVADVHGYTWISTEGKWWRLTKDVAKGYRQELLSGLGPYTIIYTPKEES